MKFIQTQYSYFVIKFYKYIYKKKVWRLTDRQEIQIKWFIEELRS